MVATNSLRNPDGSGKGLTLQQAQGGHWTDYYELCQNQQALCRVKMWCRFAAMLKPAAVTRIALRDPSAGR
jgi:hypothetical protein